MSEIYMYEVIKIANLMSFIDTRHHFTYEYSIISLLLIKMTKRLDNGQTLFVKFL